MMKLSTMWKVDATIDAAGSSPIVECILESWAHDAGSVRFFRSSANFIYTFDHEGKRYFLRFADGSERSRTAIEAEIDVVHWLAGAGLNVATPIPSSNRNFVESVETELGVFHAVVFNALEGSQFELKDITESQYREWGETLGNLHAALKNYQGPGLSERRSWQDDLVLVNEYIPNDATALWSEWEQVGESLNSLRMDSDSYGLIHFDFELDNLVWGDNGIGILDLDDCASYWYVADVAFALRDLFGDSPNLSNRSFRHFVDGYSEHCPLSKEMILKISLFLRMSKLLQYARMAHSLDLDPEQSYPEWLVSLGEKLKNRIETYKKKLEERGLHSPLA